MSNFFILVYKNNNKLKTICIKYEQKSSIYLLFLFVTLMIMAKTTATKTASYSSSSTEKTTFDKFELWGEKNHKKLFYVFLSVSLLFSTICFNLPSIMFLASKTLSARSLETNCIMEQVS
jgi:hypothetical protein